MSSRCMRDIAAEDNLYEAWRRVRENRGGPGTDAVKLGDFEKRLMENLACLRRRLLDETYVPLPLRRASIPKRQGGQRDLAIPAVGDRVAQRAFLHVLEPRFEALFLDCSFGYRPRRGVAEAVERVLRYRAAGFDWIVDADIASFFPSVDHDLLLARLRETIYDRAVLRVISLWLEAGELQEAGPSPPPSLLGRTASLVREAGMSMLQGPDLSSDGDYARNAPEELIPRFGREAMQLAWSQRSRLLPLLASRSVLAGSGLGIAVLCAALVGQHLASRHAPRKLGTPQGGPISPLLSNVYLHAFDSRMTGAGLRLVRYVDDFVICCASEARARHALETATRELERLRLRLHAEKTRIVSCRDTMQFLGYAFDTDGAFPVPPEPDVNGPRGHALRAHCVAGMVLRNGAGRLLDESKAIQSGFRERWAEIRDEYSEEEGLR